MGKATVCAAYGSLDPTATAIAPGCDASIRFDELKKKEFGDDDWIRAATQTVNKVSDAYPLPVLPNVSMA